MKNTTNTTPLTLTNIQKIEKIMQYSTHKSLAYKSISRLAYQYNNPTAWDMIRDLSHATWDDVYQEVLTTIWSNIDNIELAEIIVERTHNKPIKRMHYSSKTQQFAYTEYTTTSQTIEDEHLRFIFTDKDESGRSQTFTTLYFSPMTYINSMSTRHFKRAYASIDDDTCVTLSDELYRVSLAQTEGLDYNELVEMIRTFAKTLSQFDKSVFCQLIDGLTYRQIAEKHEVSLRQVQNSISRIRKAYANYTE